LTAVCLLTLVGGGVFVLTASRPKPVVVPKTFKTFAAADGSFRCEYPEGWKKRSGDSHGIASLARFQSGGAVIDVESDLTGSLMGDMPSPGGGMPGGETPGGETESAGGGAAVPDLSSMPGMEKLGLGNVKMDRRPAVERLHEGRKKLLESELKADGIEEVTEQPAKAFRSQLGDARWSEFTGKGGFMAGDVHGYRATIMGTERAIYVTCRASEKEWKVVDAAFKRVIGSVGPGTSR
jgi:hypothetical protein